MRRLVGLVDQRGRADRDRRRAARAAPRLPRVLAVDDGVQRRVARCVRAVGDDVDAVAAVRAGAAVRPLDHVVVGHLRVVGDRVPAGRAELRRRADLDADVRRRRRDRAEARRAVAGREERRGRVATDRAVDEVGLLARCVHAVVVELRGAVRVGRHVARRTRSSAGSRTASRSRTRSRCRPSGRASRSARRRAPCRGSSRRRRGRRGGRHRARDRGRRRGRDRGRAACGCPRTSAPCR